MIRNHLIHTDGMQIIDIHIPRPLYAQNPTLTRAAGAVVRVRARGRVVVEKGVEARAVDVEVRV